MIVKLQSEIEESCRVLAKASSDETLLKNLSFTIEKCVEVIRSNRKIIFAGNGGSAADAQHMAGEYVSRFAFDRKGMAAIALTTDTSIITAIGNDYGYDKMFSRQIEALGQSGDLFMAYSTSGNSENIIEGLRQAREQNLFCVGLTGQNNGEMEQLCDIVLRSPSTSTPKIQEVHAVLGHTICGEVEAAIYGSQ